MGALRLRLRLRASDFLELTNSSRAAPPIRSAPVTSQQSVECTSDCVECTLQCSAGRGCRALRRSRAAAGGRAGRPQRDCALFAHMEISAKLAAAAPPDRSPELLGDRLLCGGYGTYGTRRSLFLCCVCCARRVESRRVSQRLAPCCSSQHPSTRQMLCGITSSLGTSFAR